MRWWSASQPDQCRVTLPRRTVEERSTSSDRLSFGRVPAVPGSTAIKSTKRSLFMRATSQNAKCNLSLLFLVGHCLGRNGLQIQDLVRVLLQIELRRFRFEVLKEFRIL